MNEGKDIFHYTYSSKQQEEIERIREKYIPKEESKMDRLRRLDASATKPGMVAAISIGVVSVLLFGIGMCCTMVWMGAMFIPGIVIGVIGIAGIAAAYPLYAHITKKRREKLAPEILRLTDELSQE